MTICYTFHSPQTTMRIFFQTTLNVQHIRLVDFFSVSDLLLGSFPFSLGAIMERESAALSLKVIPRWQTLLEL